MKKIILYIVMLMILIVSVTSLNCTTLTTDIFVDIDPEPYINPKIHFFGELPVEYRSHNMKCFSYVKSIEDKIIQINPQPVRYSISLIPFWRKKEESREYFQAYDGVVNSYITYKDLVAYTTFVLELECISEDNGDSVIGQKCITPFYKELKNVGTRAVWSMENADMLIILIIVVIVIIVFLGGFYRKGRKLLKG